MYIKKFSQNLQVTVFERLDRVGKKLSLTGNGRCNISNADLSISHFHGSCVQFADGILKRFGSEDTVSFFEKIGVLIKEGEKGKLYPYSLQASSVCDALRFAAERLGVKFILNREITSAAKKGSKFILNGSLPFDAVIIATGGIAGGKIACDTGYNLLCSLSHTKTKLFPAIVQLKTDNTYTKQLKGIKIDAMVTVGGKSDVGEVLFCDYGLSGPPIMQLSRYAKENSEVILDLMPNISAKELKSILLGRTKMLKGVSCKDFFCGMLQNRIGQVIIKYCGLSVSDTADFSEKQINLLTDAIKGMRFTVRGNTGFSNAQVTSGGIKTDEFYADSLMSKLIGGLFACGEVLDIDGDCGGYNLQWAWSSAFTAAKGAVKYLGGEK